MTAAARDLQTADPWAPRPLPGQDDLPYDDGEPMESPRHRMQMSLLIDTLVRHLAGRPEVFIGGNMGLYYSELQVRNNDFKAPDFFFVADAIPDRVRKSWVVWEEDGKTPDVVIELLSPTTEREDRGRKMRVYASLKVAEYYLFDPHTGLFEGYRLDPRAYVRAVPLVGGDLECGALPLRLGVVDSLYQGERGPWLRWKTHQGVLLPTGDENAEAERARADEEKARADEQKARADRLAERLRALGVDPEV